MMRYFLFALLSLFLSCSNALHPLQADAGYYKLSDTLQVDSTIVKFIQPYHDSLEKDMRQVIARSDVAMEKGKPESLMGNFVADLLLEKGKDYNNGVADLCIVNYGGLRIPLLPAGNITKGIIFEMMPFDNFLVVMELKGAILKNILDHAAAQGGWPVAGINFSIKEGKAAEIFVNKESLQEDRIYQIIISDYLADGGENLLFLRSEKRRNTGVLLRDAILEYLQEQTEQGKTITTHLDNRITVQ